MSLKLIPPSAGRSPYWYVRGTINKRSICASTKTRDKAAARRFKNELELKLAQTSNRKSRPVTFREAAALYLEYRHPSRADRQHIERLCAVIGDYLLADVRQHVLVDAATAIYGHCAPETRNRQAITPASSVLHYAAENDLCPYIRVRKFKEKRPEPRALSKEGARRLIEAATGQMKLILVFLFSQGWRISDVIHLLWKEVNLAEATVKYHVSKTDEWLTMPLHLKVLDMLRAEQKQVGKVFHWGNKSNFYRDLRPFCASVGIHFTPHMARHSFATWLSQDGANLKEIMQAGGWSDHKSVLRYTKIDEKQVRATLNRIRT